MEQIGRDSFESGFYKADDPYTQEKAVDELVIPNFWLVNWVQGIGGNVRPEWSQKDKTLGHPEVFDGRYAASVHHSYAQYHTVLYRYVDAEVGTAYRFDAQMMGKSDPKSGFSLAIGIDPYGGSDWGVEDVKWQWYTRDMSTWEEGKWHAESSPIVEAKSTRITLYLRAWCRFKASAAAIFDDTYLYADAAQPPPTPPSGDVDYARIRQIVRDEVIIVSAKWEERIKQFLAEIAKTWGET